MGRLSKAVKGLLDMSQAARMKRAAEQGYRGPWFHASSNTIVEPSKITNQFDESARQELTSIANSLGVNDYQGLGRVLERNIKNNNTEALGLDMETAQNILNRTNELLPLAKGEINVTPQVEKLGFDEFRLPEGNTELGIHFGTKQQAETIGTPFEFMLNEGKQIRLNDLGTWTPDQLVNAIKAQGLDIPDFKSNAEIRNWLENQGYGSIIYKNEAEGVGDSVIMLNPSNIRSINAAFDPAKKESSNLMASVAGGAVGVGAMAAGNRAQASPMDQYADYPTLQQAFLPPQQSIQAAAYPVLLDIANKIDRYDDIFPVLGEDMAGGVTAWLRKMGYDDEMTMMDHFMAALDFM